MANQDIPAAVVELKRLEVSQSRFHEVFSTVRILIICGTIAFSVWAISASIVRIVEKPAWLELALAIIAPAGFVMGVFKYWLRRTRKQVEAIQSQPNASSEHQVLEEASS